MDICETQKARSLHNIFPDKFTLQYRFYGRLDERLKW